MDGNKQPDTIDVMRLKTHFKTSYNLNDEQIETMLVSSVKSLTSSLAAIDDALRNQEDMVQLSRSAHGIKGLFLNMGEQAWAEVARELEMAALAGEKKDYRGLVEKIKQGVGVFLLHTKE